MIKSRRSLIIFQYIFKLLFWVNIFFLGYYIYLSTISFDPSFSTPLLVIVILDTYLWLGLVIILLIINLRLKLLRKKRGIAPYRFSVSNQYKTHRIRTIIGSILFVCLICFLVIILIQPVILYHPNHSSFAYDKLIESNKYELYEINDNKVTYYGFGSVDQSNVSPTIIYFGGNGESSAQTFYKYDQQGVFEQLEGYNFIMIDYPGYGLSEGKTNNKNILNMATYVFEYISLLDYVDQDKLYIYGYSLGTGVATYISSIKDVTGLILIAPYSSIIDLYNSKLPIFKGILKNLVTQEFDSQRYAQDCEIKPLIIASKNDETIPIELSLKLFDAFRVKPEMFILDDEAHNEFLNNQSVIDKIVEYLNL